MDEIRLTLELYKTGDYYDCWLSDNAGGSGIEVEAATKEEFIEELGPYIEDYLCRMDGNK